MEKRRIDKMKKEERKGMSFGLTSGVITTLGLLIGLDSTTHSKLVLIGGVITIAVADALSDALGMHLSEESDGNKTKKEIWRVTFSTAWYKFIVALSFLIPILLLELNYAVILDVIWGIFLLSVLSFKIAKREGRKPFNIIKEHLFIALIVIVITYCLGSFIGKIFG